MHRCRNDIYFSGCLNAGRLRLCKLFSLFISATIMHHMLPVLLFTVGGVRAKSEKSCMNFISGKCDPVPNINVEEGKDK